MLICCGTVVFNSFFFFFEEKVLKSLKNFIKKEAAKCYLGKNIYLTDKLGLFSLDLQLDGFTNIFHSNVQMNFPQFYWWTVCVCWKIIYEEKASPHKAYVSICRLHEKFLF